MAVKADSGKGSGKAPSSPLRLDACGYDLSPNLRGVSSSMDLVRRDGCHVLTVTTRRAPGAEGGKAPEETRRYLVREGDAALEKIAGIVREYGVDGWESLPSRPELVALDATNPTLRLASGDRKIRVAHSQTPLDGRSQRALPAIKAVLQSLAIPENEVPPPRVNINGRMVRTVPGTGAEVDGAGADLDYEGKLWWVEEGFVGTYQVTQGNLKAMDDMGYGSPVRKGAVLVIREDGTLSLTRDDGPEWVGRLSEKAKWRASRSGGFSSPVPQVFGMASIPMRRLTADEARDKGVPPEDARRHKFFGEDGRELVPALDIEAAPQPLPHAVSSWRLRLSRRVK